MKRRTFDKIVTTMGAGLTVFLFVIAGLLNWGYSFADQNVSENLTAQNIFFPEAGSDSLEKLAPEDKAAIEPFAGQQLTTGEQAKAYADHYIGAHVKGIAGGKTYSEVSGAALAANAKAQANPGDAVLAAEAGALMGQRMSLFMGETLKGLLGFSYAFWQIGQIAKLAAGVALVGGILMLLLTVAGYLHLRRTDPSATI
ncbi:MAG: hypothetical protein RL193_1243 [Actinomycetota bacterium]|jgi:hypothetical protein